MNKIKKILIANRGEIAIRIVRAAKSLNIKSVAIYSDEDCNSAHRLSADENQPLGGGSLTETYLNIELIIEIAKSTNCQAIHPGYGFLAENHEFAKACLDNGIIFIGPTWEIIEKMGNKIIARDFVKNTGVSIISGIEGRVDEILSDTDIPEFPLLVKAAAGGGGKGMRIVQNKNELEPALKACNREATNYFGNGSVFVEKYLINPRHVEVQLLGDDFGNVVHLFERDCSIQRRYQKIIEESPASVLSQSTREKICNDAVKIAKAAKYKSAGTIEFLLDEKENYYFLEMNTRIQVEHPVTEAVTDVDIVAEQIKIADGQKLSYTQSDITQNGHAIECRIYAEDSENNFIPSPGIISFYQEPDDNSIRIDSSLVDANEIKSSFDPMISKIIVHENSREEAINNMQLALSNYHIHGIKTNINFLKSILADNLFRQNKISTKYCENTFIPIYQKSEKRVENYDKLIIAGMIYSLGLEIKKNSIWESIGYWRAVSRVPIKLNNFEYLLSVKKNGEKSFSIKIGEEEHKIINVNIKDNRVYYQVGTGSYEFVISQNEDSLFFISKDGVVHTFERMDLLKNNINIISNSEKESDSVLRSSMPGKVIKILVSEGDNVKKDTELIIVESMKMENSYFAKEDFNIEKINVKVNDNITSDTELIIFGKKNNEE